MPNNPLARYHFVDDHGHPLENCVEYRKLLAEVERLRAENERLEDTLAHLVSRSVCQTVEGWWFAHGETFQTKKDAMQHVITQAEDEMKEAARKAVEDENG